jgi:hypothetical protein
MGLKRRNGPERPFLFVLFIREHEFFFAYAHDLQLSAKFVNHETPLTQTIEAFV